MQPEHVIARLEKDALPWLAASWDHSGIQIRGNRDRITRMAVALDPTPETIRTAVDLKADFVLTHHPLGLTPQFPTADNELYATMSLLMANGIWLYAAHTTLDAQPEGPANWLARKLGLTNQTVLEPTARQKTLLVRIPQGRNLCPIDLPGVVTVIEQENLVELVVWKDQWSKVRQELEVRHGQVFDYHTLILEEPSRSYGFGCIGDLKVPLDWSSFQSRLAGLLDIPYWTRIGNHPPRVSRVAYCPGSGASLAHRAFTAGAHVYITGDIKYHQAQEMEPMGLTLDVGHYILEEKMMRVWLEMLKRDFNAHGMELVFIPGKNPLCVEKA